MSTAQPEARAGLPRLVDGERLDRATFHRRYAAMPAETRAELIGGVVHVMASPLKSGHGRSDRRVQFWLGYYESFPPGVDGLANASVFLGDSGEHQPDGVLRILPALGGRTHDEGEYCAGGPELVAEVSDSTLRLDLGARLVDYERAGVPEYVVVGLKPPAVRWHALRGGKLVEVEPDADGLYRSQVFPGLWLDPAALLRGDLRRVREVVDLGLASPEHADFARRLAQAGGARRG